jgi:L-rhamnono-1,4-lactonase
MTDHLCKPDLSTPASFTAWSVALEAFTDKPYVYMKLSGAFNEFAPEPTPATVPALLELLKPYFDRVYEVFGSERIMFGSDWPVCNVGGPRRQIDEEGKQSNWGLWRDVVEAWMDERKLDENIKEDIWWRTGAEAYRIGEL